MNIDNIAEGARFCKESGKPIIDGKCVCSGEPVEKECRCQNNCHDITDVIKIIPFIIYLSKLYKGPNEEIIF